MPATNDFILTYAVVMGCSEIIWETVFSQSQKNSKALILIILTITD